MNIQKRKEKKLLIKVEWRINFAYCVLGQELEFEFVTIIIVMGKPSLMFAIKIAI